MDIFLHHGSSPVAIRRIRTPSFTTRKDEYLLENFVDSSISPGSKKCILCNREGKKVIVHSADQHIHAVGVCSREHEGYARMLAERTAESKIAGLNV